MDILDQKFALATRVSHAMDTGDGCVLELETSQDTRLILSVTACHPDILRLRLSNGSFSAPAFDAVRRDFFSKTDVNTTLGDTITLTTESLTLIIGRDPFQFMLYDAYGRLLYEEQTNDRNAVGAGLRPIPHLGCLPETSGNPVMTLNARLHPNEHIFGLGERFGEFDKRGQQVRMWNADTLGCRDHLAYKNIPFYISSRGYGLFVNSHRDVTFDIGSLSNASLCVQTPGQSAEIYLLTGTPKQMVGAMTHMTGPAVLPPDWSFGLWYSTGFQGTTSDDVLKDAEDFRARKVSCSVFHFDCYWLRENMWCDFVWDDAAYPNRKEMLRQLSAKGYRVCLWINPYVTCKTEMYAEGAQKGYFVKNADGDAYLADLWHSLLSLCAILDVTNPQAVVWFQKKLRALMREGVHALKTDFGEDIPEDALFYNGKTGSEMRNIYSSLYNQIVNEVVCEFDGLVWARSGTAGMQKMPVCWSGDARSCYEGLAATLRSGLSLGLSGVPFWSHDIGGFYGPVSDEIFVRWAQFGLFSSHSRLHGTTTRLPWAFSPEASQIVCDTIALRERLMPYILKTAKDCVLEGLPFIRPLWVAHPDDPACLPIWDEYYFGEAFLVAPMLGGESRAVYLPEGSWKHWYTQKVYEGSRYYQFHCPLNEMLLFVNTESCLDC